VTTTQHPEPVDFRTTRIILTANEPDLLDTLRIGAMRAGVDPARLVVRAVGAPVEDRAALDGAGLAIIAVRRGENDPPFRRALKIAERLATVLDPHSVQVVLSIPSYVRLAPKLERWLTGEILHQLDAVGVAPGAGRRWGRLRLRASQAGLRAAGVRVFRLKVRP
jgi:hypothetical protein